jgi:superfamily II DNA or RNA helicase
MCDIVKLYNINIYERYKDLKNSEKKDFDNNDLWKIFEWYSAIMLYYHFHKYFYEYNDISPDFKEQNKMSRRDTGIDLCNLEDTIVQCKLRNNSLSWTDCATFFGSQNIFCEERKQTIIRWSKLIITRNSDCKLSENLLERSSLFLDKPFNKTDLINYCEKLLINPPKYPIKQKTNFNLRDYQNESIDLIKSNNKNICICIPTGTGKNIIIIHSLDINKHYLILVPRIILMEQLYDELLIHRPDFKSKIQLIGDSNNIFNKDINITICVFNSINITKHKIYDKIFVDEAHHIDMPEIYDIQKEENNYEEDEYDNLIFVDHSDDEIDMPENNDNNDLDEPDNKSYIELIRDLQKFNNNVYLSATIDPINNFLYYKKDIRDMIEEGYLSDYNIHIPIFSHDPTNRNICEFIIKNYKNIIIYCENRRKGKQINQILNSIQKNCSRYIDCYTSKKERKDIIKKYKNGDIPFLVNVKVLVEGFDAPITKGVCFIHLPSSSTTVIQIIGRALRKHPTKTIANVILPFSTKEEENNINTFLRTISRNDKRIKKSYETKQLGGYISIETFEEELTDDSQFKFNMIFDKMGICMNSQEIWDENLNKVKDFINLNEKLPRLIKKKNRKTEKDKDENRLAEWIHTNKKNYKNKKDGMKEENRREKWEKFTEEFKEYFD